MLRGIWGDLGIESILEHQVKEKLQVELLRSGAESLIRVGNPAPLFRFPRPFIAAELGLSYEESYIDDATKHWDKRYKVTSLYRVLLDENWLYGEYRGQGESKLARPESIGNLY